MCTLLAVIPRPGGVLQVAANRDEFLARPASPPQRWPGLPAVLAPRDEQAHGTWLGVNAHRLFVGVTNRHGVERDSRRASRGQLVAEALRAPSVEALHARLAGLGPRVYNPFHLLYADASGHAGLTVCDGTRVVQEVLGPGLHALTERSFGAGDEGVRVARARAFFKAGERRFRCRLGRTPCASIPRCPGKGRVCTLRPLATGRTPPFSSASARTAAPTPACGRKAPRAPPVGWTEASS